MTHTSSGGLIVSVEPGGRQKARASVEAGLIQYGHPLSTGGLGASLSLYQGGQMDYIEGGVKQKTVTSQRDLAASLGYAHLVGGVSLGIATKFLSSELAQTDKASTVALDLGAATSVSDHFRVAAAVQNLGAKLKYGSGKSDIPQTARLGAAYAFETKLPFTLVVDLPYLLNEARLDAAVGGELKTGPMAFRIGYRSGIDLGGLSLGAGFALNRFSLDYAFGLVQDLQSSHRVSVMFRFGSAPEAPLVRAPEFKMPEHRPAATAAKRKAFPIDTAETKKDKPKDPVALKPAPAILAPSEPVPVFNGVGRSVDCSDPHSGAGIINYSGGRADCNK